MEIKKNKLYFGKYCAEDLLKKFGCPLYVYEEEIIRCQIKKLKNCINYNSLKLYYACKANTNLAIMKIMLEEGCCIDTVSCGEVYAALKAGFKAEQILYTGNNVTDDEFRWLIEREILVNIGSLSELARYGRINQEIGSKAKTNKICVRINSDAGAGFHDHVITSGVDCKFGIYYKYIDEIIAKANQYKLKIIGIHHHIGSGILDVETFLYSMNVLLKYAVKFKELEFVDFGGGFGVPYNHEKKLNIDVLGMKIKQVFEKFCVKYGKELSLFFEPGRYLVAEAGVLLCRVNTLNKTPKYEFVGVDTGFNHLVRVVMYGSYHEIINASNLDDTKKKYIVGGNICESGDIFTMDSKGLKLREISNIKEGDVLAILTAGAYGMSMASNYNMRVLPAEVLINREDAKLIRRRQSFDDLLKEQI